MLTQTPSSSASAPVEDELTRKGRGWRIVVAVLLSLSVLLIVGYTGISFYIATQLQIWPRTPIYATPASLGLQYKDVTFPSRYDNLQIKGWFIPGILPDGQLTSQRTILIVHGIGNNRADKSAGLLNLSSDLAHHGFAILDGTRGKSTLIGSSHSTQPHLVPINESSLTPLELHSTITFDLFFQKQ